MLLVAKLPDLPRRIIYIVPSSFPLDFADISLRHMIIFRRLPNDMGLYD